MVGPLFKFGGLSLVCCAFVLPAHGGGGYLPMVGPAPLRYLTPPRPSTHHYLLPVPAPEPAPEPPPKLAEAKLSAAKAKPRKPAPPVAPAPTPATEEQSAVIYEAASGPPQTQPPATGPEEIISPQMFLKYFNQPTNAPVGTPRVPIVTPGAPALPTDFTPPKAAPPPH